jgi:hypothetical protein
MLSREGCRYIREAVVNGRERGGESVQRGRSKFR